MGNQCIVNIKNENEWNQYLQGKEKMILFYKNLEGNNNQEQNRKLSNGIENLLNDQCMKRHLPDQNVGVISCDAKFGFCRELFNDLNKDIGLPNDKYIPGVIIMDSNGSNFQPIREENDVKSLMVKLSELTSSQQRQSQPQPQPQRSTYQNQNNAYSNHQNVYSHVQNLIRETSELIENTRIKLNANDGFKYVKKDPLCIPGISCSHKEFNKSAMNYLLN